MRFSHGGPDTMAHEPNAFQRSPHRPMKPIPTALFAGNHQIAGPVPMPQRDMRSFEHCTDRGAELLAASIAPIEVGARSVPLEQPEMVRLAAVDANWTIRPDDAFYLGETKASLRK
jgi:hypothetical protein